MHCLKLLGLGPVAKTFDRQFAEIHIRIAAMNRFTASVTPVTLPVALTTSGVRRNPFETSFAQ